MPALMRIVLAQAMVATFVVQNILGRAPACSDGGSVQTLLQSNERCNMMDVGSPSVSTDTCCGLEQPSDALTGSSSSSSSSSAAADVCREVRVSSAYAEGATDINADDQLELSLTLDVATTDDVCCRECSCMGDPDCLSFSGERRSWVLCDGRRRGNCRMGRSPCRKQRDHMGNRCKWLKKEPEWLGWDESGSPCQANWEKSGYANMTMYEANGFLVRLWLGERGVIRSIDTTNSETGAFYSMTADDCFAHDPRQAPGDFQAAAQAWTAQGGAPVPSEWSVETPNDVEIRWKIADAGTETFVEATCTQAPGTTRRRIDVQRLYSTNDAVANEDGFCVTSEIERGEATAKYMGTTGNFDDFAFQQKCMERNLPGLLAQCKFIMGIECGPYNLDDQIEKWCESADLTYTDASGDVDTCKDELVQTGSQRDRALRWTEYLCQVNRAQDQQDCVAMVAQFGWSYFETKGYSNGLPASGPTVGTSSCGASVDDYEKLDDTSCALGVAVEYESSPGVWEQSFFVPADRPPCQGSLLITGDTHEELFLYPIRFRQCSLSRECLADTACSPTVGFEVSVKFNTLTCANRGTLECFSEQCDMDEDTARDPQQVCGATPSEPAPIGSCNSCCVTENLLGGGALPGDGDTENGRCREVRTQRPFCDPSASAEDAARCDMLETDAGQGMLTLELERNTSELSCCKTCLAWGDPLVSSFEGVTNKAILCDGRNSRCVVREDTCLQQKDQEGRTCSWNADIANQLEAGVRSDIGAYGSPCQAHPDSGEAQLTMYERDDFKAVITNGERSVITHTILTTTSGEFTLTADDCFNDDPYSAWSMMFADQRAADPQQLTQSLALRTGIVLTFEEGDREHERKWSVVDPTTGIFMKIVCLRRESSAGFVGGYRMNIEALIDTDTVRDTTADSGFCIDAELDVGDATVNANGIDCQENTEGLVEMCRAVESGACRREEIVQRVQSWCASANVFPGSADRSDQCVDTINPNNGNGAGKGVLNRWIGMYCDAVAPLRDAGTTPATWRALCISRMQNEGFAEVVSELGNGKVSSTSDSAVYCASSPSEYFSKDDADPCMPGVSVQWLKDGQDGQNDDDWTEAFFVPQNLPPCGGSLQVPAADYPELFTRPMRIVQCEIDSTECPVDTHQEVHCSPQQGFTVNYKFDYNNAICNNDQRLLR